MVFESLRELRKRAQESPVRETRREEEAKIIREAAEAYVALGEIIRLIAEGKLEDARRVLEEVQPKVEKLYKEEGLTYMPVRSVVYEYRGVTSVEEAQKLLEEVREAIERNDLIRARELLNILRNEIVVDTYVLPLNVLKEAIDLALEFAKLDEWVRAVEAIRLALASIRITKAIIPRPLLEAYYLLEEAAAIYEERPEDAVQLLEDARHQVELTKVLGYVQEDAVKSLLQSIEKLESEIRGKTATKAGFTSVQEDVQKMKEETTITTQEEVQNV